jgi:hypothetical protein
MNRILTQFNPLWRWFVITTALVGSTLVLSNIPSLAQNRTETSPITARLPIFGVNFISSAEDRAPGNNRTPASLEQQYQHGLSTGATWNRWPIYWFNVEQNPGSFNWSTQDATVVADIGHGLKLNAILLGTPGFYTTNDSGRRSMVPRPRPGSLSLDAAERATPVGLYEPVFTDGSSVPGPGKTINPNNKWGHFVWLAVNRYRPGGAIAQIQGWPPGVGITHWEMWNEPDLDIFWDASREDYARLLKVGYAAAKQADPNAWIIFAGLANNYAKLNYYRDVLAIFEQDPQAKTNGYFHDILATHSYFHAWKSWYHVFRARGVMAEFGLDKPIWLNETGVTAWNDYPGPVWDPQSALRSTMTEQADYTIQTTFYALFAGAEAIFHFQLYDGCGNQPQGTDFPPHNGELCDADGLYNGKPCAGDANGLYRNPPDAACFTQHPQPASSRTNLATFEILTRHLTDVEPYWRKRPGEPGVCPMQNTSGGVFLAPPQEWIAFYRPATKERIVGMWTLCARHEIAVIEATSPDGQAMLLLPDGSTQSITAIQGRYSIPLAPATNRNPFGGEGTNAIYPIGGRPVILIEKDLRTVPDFPNKVYLPLAAGSSFAVPEID